MSEVILQKNLNALKKFMPGFYNQYFMDPASQYYAKTSSELLDIISEAYEPKNVTSSQLFWEQNVIQGKGMASFYGLGDFVYIREYLVKMPHEAVVIYEKNVSHFLEILRDHDCSEYLSNEKIVFLIGFNPIALFKYLSDLLKKTNFLLASEFNENFFDRDSLAKDGDYYLSLSKAFIRAKESVNLKTVNNPEDTFRGMINMLNNMNYFGEMCCALELKNCAQGQKGAIVSTGPSLDLSIKILKENKDRFIIYCADSALDILLKYGVKPDFVGSLERLKMTSQLFNVNAEYSGISLLCPPYIYPETLNKWRGPKFIMPLNGLRSDWLFDFEETYDCGLSVANMGMFFMSLIGCEQVYLFGQDFSFAPHSEKNHASGCHEAINRLLLEEKAKQDLNKDNPNWVQGNNGEKIFTRDHFRAMALQMEEEIATYNLPTFNVIPNDYGMKINNTIQINPEDLSDRIRLSQADSERVFNLEICKSYDRSTLKKNLIFHCQELEKLKLFFEEKIFFMSEFLHENFHLFLDDQGIKKYLEYFSSLQNDVSQNLLKNDTFVKVLSPFIARDYFEFQKRQYQTNLDASLDPKEQIFRHHQNWKFCYERFFSWAARLSYFFNKKVREYCE